MSRYNVTAAALTAALLLSACGDREAGAGTGPIGPDYRDVAGRWAATRIDDQGLPSVVRSGPLDGGGTWEFRVLWDSLSVTADGRWTHRARIEERQNDVVQYRTTTYDRGTIVRTADTLRFESTWIENVRFTGTLAPAGELRIDHDFLLDEGEATMHRMLARSPAVR